MSEDRVRGPWEGEKQIRIFDGVENFNDILNIIVSAYPGTIKDSSGQEINAADIVSVKNLFEQGKLVAGALINAITRKNGLREAVVRAMTPNFAGSQSIDYILHWLEFFRIQDEALNGIKGENGKSLGIMFDSSGNPLKIAETIKNIKNIADFVKDPNNDKSLADMYMRGITSKYGLQEAVKRNLGLV